jgi:hypothetical protein
LYTDPYNIIHYAVVPLLFTLEVIHNILERLGVDGADAEWSILVPCP